MQMHVLLGTNIDFIHIIIAILKSILVAVPSDQQPGTVQHKIS